MPISTRYDTILTQLTSQLPTLRPRLAEPLVCALVGMRQSVSAQQRAIAGAMPLKTKQHSKIQRLRRLLVQGGKQGPAIVLGKPVEQRAVVRHDQLRSPHHRGQPLLRRRAAAEVAQPVVTQPSHRRTDGVTPIPLSRIRRKRTAAD